MEVGRNQREIAVPRLIINVTSDLERNLISKQYVNDGKIYEIYFIDKKSEARSTLQVGGTRCSKASILLLPRSMLGFNLCFWTSPYLYRYILSQMSFSCASKIRTCKSVGTTLHKDEISPPFPSSSSINSKTGAGLILFEVIKHKWTSPPSTRSESQDENHTSLCRLLAWWCITSVFYTER